MNKIQLSNDTNKGLVKPRRKQAAANRQRRLPNMGQAVLDRMILLENFRAEGSRADHRLLIVEFRLDDELQ